MDADKLAIYKAGADKQIIDIIVEEAEALKAKQIENKKQDEQEKKMQELDKAGGNMSANDIMSLMNDDNLVERYTKHLTKILFQYADPFIKAKYQAYLELTEPNQQMDFFSRMKLDKELRDKK